MQSAQAIAELSHNFLIDVKRNNETDQYRTKIRELDGSHLQSLLENEDAAKTFWINVYNAYVQLLLKNQPELYETKRRFFSSSTIEVGGSSLSLDDIEHGILRSSKWKYGLGYIPRLFFSSFEKNYRLPRVDSRIHFTLNCGAESCPPIGAYSPGSIEQELELSTESFLQQSSCYNESKNTVRVTRLLFYYRGDFGGRNGIYRLLDRYDVIPDGTRPRIRYKSYDWSLQPGNYRDNSG